MNDLVHFATGLLVVGALGIRGRRRAAIALFAVAPDWDVITTPLVPYLIDWFSLSHAHGHTLVIALGHGAFSHSIFAVGAIFVIALTSGLRGRSLVAAGVGLASHYPLDFVLTWSVWPFLPFSSYGIAWGWVIATDPVVTVAAALLAFTLVMPDLVAWWRSRRGLAGPRHRRWMSGAALAALTVVIVAPAVFQGSVVSRFALTEDAVVDPVSYTSHALIESDETSMRVVLVDMFDGVLAERSLARRTDLTNGAVGAMNALETAERALVEADAPSPLVRPVFTVRHGYEQGALTVEAREAKDVVAAEALEKDEAGIDIHFDETGRVDAMFAVKGERRVALPEQALPTWVKLATRSAAP